MDFNEASTRPRNDHICYQCKAQTVAAIRRHQYEVAVRNYLRAKGLKFEDVFQVPDQDQPFTPVPRATVEVHPGTDWDLLAGFYSNFPSYEAKGMFVPPEPCPLRQRAWSSSDESTDDSQRAIRVEEVTNVSDDINDAVAEYGDQAVSSNASDSGYCSDAGSEDKIPSKPSMKADGWLEEQSGDKDSSKQGDSNDPLSTQNLSVCQDTVTQFLLSQSSQFARLQASIPDMGVLGGTGMVENSRTPTHDMKRQKAKPGNNKAENDQATPLHLSLSAEDAPSEAITSMQTDSGEEWSAVGTEDPEAVSMRPDPTLRFRRPKNIRNLRKSAMIMGDIRASLQKPNTMIEDGGSID